MSRRPARVTQAEIRRALKEAARAPQPTAVDILPNGVIRLVPTVAVPVGESPEPPKPKRRIDL